MDVKVSVIIPVYNQEKYLRKCLDSVVCQTLKEIEIICVDDGSTDSSLSILKDYEKSDSRIVVISQDNAGAGAARNNGLKHAKGEYLSFLDSDDFFEPGMLEKSAAKLDETGVDFVVFHSDQYDESKDSFAFAKYVVRDEELPPYRPMNFRNLTMNPFKVFVGWAWDKVYRTDFVKKNNLTFQEQRTSNDLRFVFSALVLAKQFEVIPEILAHQRRNNSESLSNTREKSWDCFYRALIELRNNLVTYGLYCELEQDFINYALHFSLWNYRTLIGDKKKILLDKLQTEWFKELGISDKNPEYFYIKNEYKEYLTLVK